MHYVCNAFAQAALMSVVALTVPLLHAYIAPVHVFAAGSIVRPGKPTYLLAAGVPVRRTPPTAMTSVDNRQVLAGLGTLGSGVLSGLYFIFSFCVMDALDAQPAASAISSMNAINVLIVNPPFVLFFLGTPLVCAWLLWSCVKEGIGSSLDNKFTTAGALVLLLGEFLLTPAVHVPKNDALAAYTLGSGSDVSVWADYYTAWTAWNHVRTLASIATVVLFSLALHFRATRLAAGPGAAARPTQMQ